jgi:DNA-binding Lrp family transcriptional regulator
LRELQADARRTNREIAAAVGVAPTTALDRARGLRQRGIIRGALLGIDLAAVADNQDLYAFVIDHVLGSVRRDRASLRVTC